MKELLIFCNCLESHKLIQEKQTISIGMIDKVSFENASFGYFSDDLTKNPLKIQKIFNLNYTFWKSKLYYLEAPNGVGKSTILRMFQSNLFGGEVFFGTTNRKNLTFEDTNSHVFHIVQASEYTPSFTKEEIQAYEGRDIWLEEQLGLKNLLDKDTVEMSGGQKNDVYLHRFSFSINYSPSL